MILTLARAYRMPLSTALAVAACALVWATPARTIDLGGMPVRTLWFLALVAAAAATLPLGPSFDGLDATFVRDGTSRAGRVLWHAAVTASVAGLLVGLSPHTATGGWFVMLAAVAVAGALLRPGVAILAVLALGSGTILLDHNLVSMPVSTAVLRLGPWVPPLLYTMCCIGFVMAPRLQVTAGRPRARGVTT